MKKNNHHSFYPLPALPFTNSDWENVVANPKIKGETEALITHAKKVYQEKNDTSIDAPFWVYPHWSISDVYTIFVMTIFVPPMFLLWPILFVYSLLPVGLNLFYISYIVPSDDDDGGFDVIPRHTLIWKIHCLFQFITSLPVQLTAIMTLLYSHTIITLFGMLYLVISIVLRLLMNKSPLERFSNNLKVIAPYQGGPNLYWHFEDCVAAVAGSVYRQGLLEFTVSFTTMFLVNPWMKYWVTGNIYLDDLGERFITQIGQPLNQMETTDIDVNLIKCISKAKPSKDNRTEIDDKMFAPHYPYPPHNKRRYAVGMQFVREITNFVHTTHFRSPEIDGEGPVATLSTSCLLPIYRVILWRNNPYHIYTGYVEANHSTGWPTQTEKNTGFEHPMWLVNSHNKLAADRKVKLSLGIIDEFFDRLIPQFNHFVRLNILGREAADAAYKKDPKLRYESSLSGQHRYQRMAEI